MGQAKKGFATVVSFCFLICFCWCGGRAYAANSVKPTISRVLDVTVNVGEEASFVIVAAFGVPDVYTYQWFEAASKVEEGIKIEGATSAQYTIPPEEVTMERNGRHYYCEVSNGVFEMTSNYARLTVREPDADVSVAPTLSRVADVTAKTGEEAKFLVQASSGVPDTYTYQWHWASDKSEEGSVIEGATLPELIIPASKVTSECNGLYFFCTVSNGKCDVTSNRALLTVQEESQGGQAEGDAPGNNGTGKEDEDSLGPGSGTVKKPQYITGVKASYTLEYGKKAFALNARTSGNGTLSYTSSNRKAVSVTAKGKVSVKGYGKVTITIRASETPGFFRAEKKVQIKVQPKKMKITSLASTYPQMMTVKWKKDKTVDGYELNIAKNAKFQGGMKSSLPKTKTSSSGGGLSSGKAYFVRMRSYKKVGKKLYYSSWSAKKKVRIK